MNEEKPTLQDVIAPIPKQEHPLHMLDNQADPETKPKIILQKSIRTYESDVAEALANRKDSVMSIAIAENKRKTGVDAISNEEKKTNIKKVALTITSIIFILAGLGGGYYLYLISPLGPVKNPTTITKIPAIVIPEKQTVISINGLAPNQIIKKIKDINLKETVGLGNITELIFSENQGSTTVRVTAPSFLEKFDLTMPDTLRRSITNTWMFGINGDGEKNSLFVILKNDFFQNAYSGMLKWENLMPEELADLFDYRNNATSSVYYNLKGVFVDKIIMNRDVREFNIEGGKTLLIYTFIDKDTLLITDSETTLKTIVEKIEKQAFVR